MSGPLNFRSRALLVAATLAILAGCTRGQSDLHRWVEHEKAQKGTPLDPLPEMKTFETFVYNDKDLRDPFGPSDSEKAESTNNGPRPDQNRPREPLEAFPLDGLKMVGTIGAGKSMQALIKDPNGVIHRVRAGNYLGQNYGRIVSIAPSEVDLVELVPRGDSWMEHEATISLADSKK
ncbi:MAG: pilus assembly protein PilP [Rhodanobacteraceae bacterium]